MKDSMQDEKKPAGDDCPTRNGKAQDDGAAALVNPRTLRILIGVLGVLLPAVLLWLGDRAEGSISAYYDDSRVGSVLPGTLFALAFYLFAYHGYDEIDNWTANFAGLGAIGVAIFPHEPQKGLLCSPVFHYISAAVLFAALILFCLWFTKTDPSRGKMSNRKIWRNRVYVICAVVMTVCSAWTLAELRLNEDNSESTLVFWLESALLWAFGVSWFVKGRVDLTFCRIWDMCRFLLGVRSG